MCTIKSLVGVGVIASSLLVSANAGDLRATLAGTNSNVYAAGMAYRYNTNVQVGVGFLHARDITIPDRLDTARINGGYITTELAHKFGSNKLFVDITGYAGRVQSNDVNNGRTIKDTVVGAGYKYDEDKFFSPYIGITSEETLYAGISKEIIKDWEIGVGVQRAYTEKETMSFVTLTYKFGSGFVSNISTALRSSIKSKLKANPIPEPVVEEEPVQVFF